MEKIKQTDIDKWYSFTTDVDIDTGEIISINKLSEYQIVKRERDIKIKEETRKGVLIKYGEIYNVRIWRKSNQTKLDL